MRPLIAVAGFAALSLQPTPVKITVRLIDVRADKGGVLRVGLHSDPGKGFPGPSAFVNQQVTPTGTEAVLTFETSPGIYAVAVHHDANANGRMDTNFLHMPKEGYGVSNDARPKLRPPRFSEAQVRVTRDTTLVVHMSY